MSFKERAALYSNYLKTNIIPFWLDHSIDKEYGGFFTCLNRKGEVYDTDKFMWLQHRQVWTFSMLYNNFEKNATFLQTAITGADYLAQHGMDSNGDWYFAMDRAGNPLIQPHSIFSDCFATMAYAQLYKATGDKKYSEIALHSFGRILARRDNPKGIYSKAVPGSRALKGFSLPMILCNLVLEIEHLLPKEEVEETLRFGINEVMKTFYREELGIIVENVTVDGELHDSYDGRLVNPGHGLESMWFVMDIAQKWGDKALIQKCVDISLNLMDYGWDKEHEGIFYFLDRTGAPLQQLEWDQKLWWVHLEATITMLKGYQLTGNDQCLAWYNKLHTYIWDKFVDPEYGEMFGYLNRQGEVLLDLKGGKWKGCFHAPRALYQLATIANKIYEQEELTALK